VHDKLPADRIGETNGAMVMHGTNMHVYE